MTGATKSFFLILLLLLPPATGWGEDLRIAAEKARSEYEAALAEARDSRRRVLEDKEMLQAALTRADRRVSDLKSEIGELKQRLAELARSESDRDQRRSQMQMDQREYMGVIREAVKDLSSLLSQSHFTAFMQDRSDPLTLLLEKDRFPGLSDIASIADLYFEEMTLSGEVDLRGGTFVASDGSEARGAILTIGPFCAAYRDGKRSGFLHYNEGDRRFFALAKQPSWFMGRRLDQYLRGEAEAVPFDFSRGAALRQLAQRTNLVDQIKNGGPIVWPILCIGVIALLIAVERTFFLNRVHANTDRLMGRVNELAGQGDWQGCERILKKQKGKPVNNVLRAGLGAVSEKRETLESVLQEAILKELPRLERFLPALNIMGAVAPLLGLLGTVTGMIATFQAITLHGAGDPRMMSGGISEALITTMLGLAVAIPIMLIHTFLRRRLEHIVGDMEEKAVALSNIICRECILVPMADRSPAGSPSTPMEARA